MTQKFFEIVLADLINKRDIAELELSEVYGRDVSITEKVLLVQDCLREISDINNQITTLTGMVSEEVVNNDPQTEDNNNN
jgi:hypothetical protein